MIHRATHRFWQHYNILPKAIRLLADKAFSKLKENPGHPSLFFKKLGGSTYWSARINDDYRAMAIKNGEIYAWFWIGPHDEYERIIKKK